MRLKCSRIAGMQWTLSEFGDRFGSHTGIHELMEDLGAAMSGRRPMLMLGGGNPAHIPAVQALWRERWRELAEDPGLDTLLGNYDTPQGHRAFLEALADSLKNQYGWAITPDHIAVVNGSQNAFFYLLNMLGGATGPSGRGRVLLPLAPEYIGYADQLLPATAFQSMAPGVELIGDHRFKYHIDFDRLALGPDIRVLCVSRPTNPTGNVLTDDEITRLEALAGRHRIPLIVDNAYGAPFPDIIFKETRPRWTDNTILVMSLSKLGLPSVRTGIVLGPPALIKAISATNAVIGLASGSLGQALVTPLLRDGRLYEISRAVIRPYYEQKSAQALRWLDEALPASLPYRIHVSEGALFLWLWFEGLPISSEELYARLKRRGVLVVSGHYFFYGLADEHPHHHACLRLSYAQSGDIVQRGVAILAEEVIKAYAEQR
jgi:valine--pyruvate aminotransferase